MNTKRCRGIWCVAWAWVSVLLAGPGTVGAATRYVSAAGSAEAPYGSWSTAARTIQDALDVSGNGDLVLVAEGVYASGGMSIAGGPTNRVAITNEVTVRSVGGPAVTSIVGQGPHGSNAVRCVYMDRGARLEGFTVTDGHTLQSGSHVHLEGGGIWCNGDAVVSNCWIVANHAPYRAGGILGGTLQNSRVIDNSAGTLGGGAVFTRILDSEIRDNTARLGGGAYGGTIYRSRIVGNVADHDGGGAHSARLSNCVLSANTAGRGGGAFGGTAESCTIIANHAGVGGGTCASLVRNTIVYYNEATVSDANWLGGDLSYSCTVPLPAGTGSFTNAPEIASMEVPHLFVGSPCIDAGSGSFSLPSDYDMDGEARIGGGRIDIGADEYHPGDVADPLSVELTVDLSRVRIGYPILVEGRIDGRAEGCLLRWGDGTITSNALRAAHQYGVPIEAPVTFEAWNSASRAAATAVVHVVVGFTNYVSPSGLHIPPFDRWETAATNIQAAISEAMFPGGTVLVSNGWYGTGGIAVHGGMTNRVAVTESLILRSVSGPAHTVIEGGGPVGDQAVRCAYVGEGARLEGFTLTNGHTLDAGDSRTHRSGGGVWCEPTATVSNCVIIGNAAAYGGGGTHFGTILECLIADNTSGFSGGGTHGGFLVNSVLQGNTSQHIGGGALGGWARNCLITNNRAGREGGGMFIGTLENCTVVGNWAGVRGGGAFESTVWNSILYENTAVDSGPNWELGEFHSVCTVPIPDDAASFTNAPQFWAASRGDFRLLSTSRCIDAGETLDWMQEATDVNGLPRLSGQSVDVGAHEFSPTATAIVYITAGPMDEDIVLTWPSTAGHSYSLYGSSNLAHGFDLLLQDRLPATPPWNTAADPIQGDGTRAYQIRVEP